MSRILVLILSYVSCITYATELEYNGFKYTLTPSVKWSEAQTQCISAGGNLTSICSEEENTYIQLKILSGIDYAWIGFKRMEGGKRFIWMDGNSCKFTNWGPDRPCYEEPYCGPCVQMGGTGAGTGWFGNWTNHDASMPDWCQHEVGQGICKIPA